MKNKFDWNTPFFRLAQSFEKVCIIFFIVSVIFFVIAGAVGGISVGEIVAVAMYYDDVPDAAIIFVRVLLFLVGCAVGSGLGSLINILCFGFIAQIIDIKNTLHKMAVASGVEMENEIENVEKKETASDTWKCPACGNEVINSANFCNKCGAKKE